MPPIFFHLWPLRFFFKNRAPSFLYPYLTSCNFTTDTPTESHRHTDRKKRLLRTHLGKSGVQMAFYMCSVWMALCHILFTFLFKCLMLVYGSSPPLYTSTVLHSKRVSIKWITVGEILVAIQVFRWIYLTLTIWPFLMRRL